MSGGDETVKIDPVSVQQAAQGVAVALGRAAEPGPVPVATGVSPIDAAAAAAAGSVIAHVSAGSADLAPRAGEVTGAADDAVAGLQAQDTKNVASLQTVGEQVVPGQLPGAAGTPGGLAQGGSARGLDGVLGPLQQVASSAVGQVSSLTQQEPQTPVAQPEKTAPARPPQSTDPAAPSAQPAQSI